MESNGKLPAACLDAINAFGEIERDCIRVVLLANPPMHMLIPLFEMLYERGSGEMWVYDENGNLVCPTSAAPGCVLGAFLSRLAMYSDYDRLQDLLGLEGAL